MLCFCTQSADARREEIKAREPKCYSERRGAAQCPGASRGSRN